MELEIIDQKRDRRGRSLHSPEERDRLLSEYDSSELTQVKFARDHGIKYSTFVGWLKTRREKSKPSENFHEVVIEQQSTQASEVELQLPNGIVLRANSANAQLTTLAKELLKTC